jgi:acyl-CoA synthetase (AMP-forming)/AMP-acid ligase II
MPTPSTPRGDRAAGRPAGRFEAFCRQHLARYKCPRSIDFSAELPRAPTGKLYKRLLREQYWEGRKTRIGG